MKNDINIQIINLLKEKNIFFTSEKIAKKLNVSNKTIIRRIKIINNTYSSPIIISKRGKGYKLDYNIYLKLENTESSLRVINSSAELRQEHILSRLLLISPKELRISDLLSELYVSESILQKDIKVITNNIKKWNLKLEHKKRYISVSGKEEDIRNALIYAVLHVNSTTDLDALDINIDKTNNKDFNFALGQVEMALRILNGSLPYPYNINLFIHIYVLLNRVRSFNTVDQQISNNLEIENEIKNNPEAFSVCKKIVDNICRYLNLDKSILKNETYYIFEYLISSRFNNVDSITLSDKTLSEAITDRYFELIGQYLHIYFEEKMKINLQKHILSMISRLKLNVNLPNALIKDIKYQYKNIFEATKKASETISKEFDLPEISEDESGFICLYFIKYKEEVSRRKIKTYIVCTTGVGTSELISTRINNSIPEIEIIGLASSFDIKKVLKEKKDIDLIISTVPIKQDGHIPVELVSAFFTKQDQRKIEKIVKKIRNEKYFFN